MSLKDEFERIDSTGGTCHMSVGRQFVIASADVEDTGERVVIAIDGVMFGMANHDEVEEVVAMLREEAARLWPKA